MLPVAKRAAEQNHRCELADVFRHYGEQYRQKHCLPLSHLRVMQAVERCRTAALGGHLQQCDSCGYERPAYNSCRNRLMGVGIILWIEALIRVTVPAYRRPVTGTIIFGALLFAGGLGGAINWTILGPAFLIIIGVLLLLQSLLRRG